MKRVYVIWNFKENRPIIAFGNYGQIIAYLTEEQAKAYLVSQHEPEPKVIGIQECDLIINLGKG